jgi:OFA family oxalate/formate antiporter-like MFS transporter
VVGQWQEKAGIRLIVSISALVCGLSLFIVSHATNIYAVYIWAFLTGTGSCFAYMSGLTVVQRWFPKKKGLVAGIVNLFFAASAAIMAPVFSSLLKTLGYVPMNTLIAVVTVCDRISGCAACSNAGESRLWREANGTRNKW